jgi:hypothetical protein
LAEKETHIPLPYFHGTQIMDAFILPRMKQNGLRDGPPSKHSRRRLHNTSQNGLKVMHPMFFIHHKLVLDHPQSPNTIINGVYYTTKLHVKVSTRTVEMKHHFPPGQCSTPLSFLYAGLKFGGAGTPLLPT